MVLGDRYEILGVVIAAKCLNIPIVHIHGGELTFGAIDDSFRHSITKFASLHFVCNDRYRQRVIQMGEDPDSVFNTGALGIDNIVNMQLMTKAELERGLNLRLRKKFLMVGFHTETVSGNTLQTCNDILTTLEKIEDTTIIFTRPNLDRGSLIWVNSKKFSSEKRCLSFRKPRRSRYLSCWHIRRIGNSSSGILEAPFLGAYTINIGDRQQGRERESIIDVP